VSVGLDNYVYLAAAQHYDNREQQLVLASNPTHQAKHASNGGKNFFEIQKGVEP
jgi:hypothetical protein